MAKEMEKKIHLAVDQQCTTRGYASPVDLLMDTGVLDRKKCEDWRHGRIPYLEAACTANLHKLSEIMKIFREYATRKGLAASFTDYRQYGARDRVLRFSKSGNPNIERAYATHYVLKREREKIEPAVQDLLREEKGGVSDQ